MKAIFTENMGKEVERVAKLHGVLPQTVLKRAVMSYCAKLDRMQGEPSYENVVSLASKR